MLIPNPFGAKHVRLRWKDGDKESVSIQSDSRALEIPDGCKEAVLEAIYSGKSDSPAWSIRMWCEDRGVMGMSDYKQMREIEEEQKRMDEQKRKEKERKEKERKRKEAEKPKENKWDY
jgi:hypothetical protein